MSAVVNRVLSGGQRATRKTINAFVGKNNFALQDRNSKKLSSWFKIWISYFGRF